MKPKIYIIILNYKGWADTIECLESVLRNDYPNYQVIVLDNNSPNNSMEYIKAWAEGKLDVWVNPAHPLRRLSYPPVPKPIPYVYYNREEAEKGGNPEIEKQLEGQVPEGITTRYPLVFIQTGENLGFASGNNVGIRYALAKDDFDSIVLLNNDTVIGKDSISKLFETKENYGDNAMYGGRIYYYYDMNKIWYDGGHFNKWLGRATHINMRKRNIPIKPVLEVNFITFCFVLLPKHIIKEIGLLDESYFMYVEDLDYSYKVWKKGYKLYHVSSSQIWHKTGTRIGGELTYWGAYWYYRNNLVFRKKLKGMEKISSIAFYLATRLIAFIRWLFKKPFMIKPMLKGILDGFITN